MNITKYKVSRVVIVLDPTESINPEIDILNNFMGKGYDIVSINITTDSEVEIILEEEIVGE